MTSEFDIIRGVLLRSTRGLVASQPLAKDLLGFGREHGPWLFGLTPGKASRLTWTAFKRAIKDNTSKNAKSHHVLNLGHELASLLGLNDTDRMIMQVILAFSQLPRASELVELMCERGCSLPVLIGEASGLNAMDAERSVRRHVLIRFGLVTFKTNWRGKVEMSLRWTFERLLDRQPSDSAGILELMVGPKQSAPLQIKDFIHVEEAEFLVRLLSGAIRERASGINLLIHGPPGTGKTELARALAKAVGCRLHAVGEALDDGEEPDRLDRICAFQMGQRLLENSGSDALLFDEMEDFVGDAQPASGDWYRGREGSKVFVNRLLETNSVPVIWTTNAIGNVDPAILRRMSYVLKLDLPSRETAMRILDHIAAEEGVTPTKEWGSLVDAAPETAAVLRVSARAARLAGEEDGGLLPAKSLARALRGQELPPLKTGEVDLELYESDRPIAELVECICAGGAQNVSMLLTGPPGTGKTALAHHFARTLDRPLLVRRTSDLLSKWVGQTEANIADAFATARNCGSVLLLDEVDSLLFDRANARANWEVSQVNELLTWLDQHPLPVIAATNFASRLDPATARRFVFKLELKPLSPGKRAAAFTRFFAMKAPASLREIGNLTPGDFALVARQLRFAPTDNPEQIVRWLAAEVQAKPQGGQRIGF